VEVLPFSDRVLSEIKSSVLGVIIKLSPDLEVTVAGLIRKLQFPEFPESISILPSSTSASSPFIKRLLFIDISVTALEDILTDSIITAETLAVQVACAKRVTVVRRLSAVIRLIMVLQLFIMTAILHKCKKIFYTLFKFVKYFYTM
jgi:hypothetical protein